MTPASPENIVVKGRAERWRRWLWTTAGVQFGSFFLYPMFICGCHFHSEAIRPSAVPILWGFYPYFFYRTKREHWIGYVNGALSVFWLFLAWESNIQFAFTR